MRVLLIGKEKDPFFDRASEWMSQKFPGTSIVRGKRSDPMPDLIQTWEGDYLISYLSPWIIPEETLKRTKHAAINFHPGPPEYPGIGCTNFAIYEGVKEFGITCHHMATKVDTGAVIAVRRFPIHPDDSVLSLTQRCYDAIFSTFLEVLGGVLEQKPLPQSSERWTRRPFTRAELNALCRITPEMSKEEARRRILATTYPGMPGAYFEKNGQKLPIPENLLSIA